MTKSLSSKAVSALTWTVFQRLGSEASTFVVGIVLARLLSPRDFGLVAMISVVTTFAQKVATTGFASELIHKDEITSADKSTTFWFNTGLGFLLYGAIWLIAPFVADFYKEPTIERIIRWSALSIPIATLNTVQTLLLSRSLEYRIQTIANVTSSIIAGVIGIAMAYHGHGVWSLVTKAIAERSIRSVLLWVLGGWRPTLEFSRVSMREGIAFGGPLLGMRLVESFFDSIYSLVLGKFYAADLVGHFARARSLNDFVTSSFAQATQKVTFPLFAAAKREQGKLAIGYQVVMGMMALITIPALTGVSVCAREIVLSLYGQKWLPAVPYVVLLGPISAIVLLRRVVLNVFKAVGRTGEAFRVSVTARLLTLVHLPFTVQLGVEYMLAVEIIVGIITYLTLLRAAGRHLGVRVIDQVRPLIPIVAASAGMAVVVWTTLQYLPRGAHMRMLVCAPLGAVVFFLLAYAFKCVALADSATRLPVPGFLRRIVLAHIPATQLGYEAKEARRRQRKLDRESGAQDDSAAEPLTQDGPL